MGVFNPERVAYPFRDSVGRVSEKAVSEAFLCRFSEKDPRCEKQSGSKLI